MEDKYYIPKEGEFYGGFEYECCKCLSKSRDKIVLDNIFVKYKFEVWDFLNHGDYYLDRCISDGMVRVKYLDKEDVESLGFKKSNKNSWIGYKDYFLGSINPEYPYFLFATIHIPVRDDMYKILVHRYYNEDEPIDEDDNYREPTTAYVGKIKNKSELKKLLMQLNIIGS